MPLPHQPLVREKRCVTTLITAAMETREKRIPAYSQFFLLQTFNHGQTSWDRFALFALNCTHARSEYHFTCLAPSPSLPPFSTNAPHTMLETCNRVFSRGLTLHWVGRKQKQRGRNSNVNSSAFSNFRRQMRDRSLHYMSFRKNFCP